MLLVSELLKDLGISYELLTKALEPGISFVSPVDAVIENPLCGVGDLCLCYTAWQFFEQPETYEYIHNCAAVIIADENEVFANRVKDTADKLSGIALYYIPHVKDLQSFLSQIHTHLYAERRRMEQLVNVEYQAMVNLLARDADINDIEAYAYKLLGNPMIVTDESFRVRIHTSSSQVDDPVWQEIVTNAYSPVKLQEQTNVNDFWARLECSPLPLFVDDKAFEGLIRRAVAKIRVGSETKGYIALLEAQRQINRVDLHILQMLAEVLSVKIKENDAILIATGQLRDEFSSDVLIGNISSARMIENRALSLGLRFSECTCVLSVQARDEVFYIGSELEGLRAALRNHCALCIYTLKGSQGYFILSFDSRKKWRRFIQKTLEDVLAQRKFIGLLSMATEKLTELHICYEQTERLRRLLPKIVELNRSLYSYGSFAPLDIISRMLTEGLESISSEAYQTLLDIDNRNGTEYIPTLRCFFSCNQSVSETAKCLFIHRNTVNYRLNRIRELLEDDFDDSLIRLHLQLSILSNDLI